MPIIVASAVRMSGSCLLEELCNVRRDRQSVPINFEFPAMYIQVYGDS